MNGDLSDRRGPSAYLHDGTTVVPAVVAAWLHRQVNFDRLQAAARDAGPQALAVLHALTFAAGSVSSTRATTAAVPRPEPDCGTSLDRSPELAAPSPDMSTTTAADVLGMTDRGVRKAIADGRLTSTVSDGRHRISTDDLARFRAARSA